MPEVGGAHRDPSQVVQRVLQGEAGVLAAVSQRDPDRDDGEAHAGGVSLFGGADHEQPLPGAACQPLLAQQEPGGGQQPGPFGLGGRRQPDLRQTLGGLVEGLGDRGIDRLGGGLQGPAAGWPQQGVGQQGEPLIPQQRQQGGGGALGRGAGARSRGQLKGPPEARDG